MTIVGAWGQPRNRYTRSTQPGKTGGTNAQGSTRNEYTGLKPMGDYQQSKTTGQGGIDYGVSKQSPLVTSFGKGFDPEFYRGMAGHKFNLAEARASNVRNIEMLKRAFASARGAAEDEYNIAGDRLGMQMGASGFGRSGVLQKGAGMIDQEYARKLGDIVSQYGTPAQKFERAMLDLARRKFLYGKEGELAAYMERENVRGN